MLKVYFACSIRGGRDNAETYRELVEYIKKSAQVLSEAFADENLTATTVLDSSQVLRRHCLDMIEEADVVIAEVTTPSLGVGFEIATAEQKAKPTLALYRKGKGNLSAMIDGSPVAKVVYYSEVREAKEAIDKFLLDQAD
jgi:nucleoside 2-deoxyribosyltransferase